MNETAVVRKLYAKRVKRISEDYIKLIAEQDAKFKKFKSYIDFELSSAEAVCDGFVKLIEKKDKEIESLKETLSVPRSHFKYIDKLTAD